MVGKGKRAAWDAFEFAGDEDEEELLLRSGKALLSPPKGKDQLVKLLKTAGNSLEGAAQTSEAAKLAVRDLAKGLARRDVIEHRDKEVRLYAAHCLCHVLRLYAPETPYSNAELEDIFKLFNMAFEALADPQAPHFKLCLSILETIGQVKCCLLLLDMDGSEDMICQLFNTLLDVVNEENGTLVEPAALEVLTGMVEEADSIPQQQLDVILGRLLPAACTESPAAYRLTAALLRRTEGVLQPLLRRFLTSLLCGARTDSELRQQDYHELIHALHETVPQVLLPVLPHLKEELEDENDRKRSATVDLAACIFLHPGGAELMTEYDHVFETLIKRMSDTKADVRVKTLGYATQLLEQCSQEKQRSQLLHQVAMRAVDTEANVRCASVAALCAILKAHPELAANVQATDHQGPLLQWVSQRVRDSKLKVRKEAAAGLGSLMRSWLLPAQEGAAGGAPSGGTKAREQAALQIASLLCNLPAVDPELSSFVNDSVLRQGLFPHELSAAEQARLWATLWNGAGSMLPMLLKSKCSLQASMQVVLRLREAAKQQHRGSSLLLGGAGSTRAPAATATSGSGAAAQPSVLSGGSAGAAPALSAQDAGKQLRRAMQGLLPMFRDVPKAEEGLQKLLEMKDNYIFKALATLAAFGTPLKEAHAAGKEVVQRVGSKGPAVDVARVLVQRMSPSLLPPEVLHSVLEAAEDSQEAQRLLVQVASAAPQLLAQSLEQVLELFDADDQLLAECAARVLAHAGQYMQAQAVATNQRIPDPLTERLSSMCTEAGPTAAKAAARALVAVLGPQHAAPAAREVCDSLLDHLKQPATLASHSRALGAVKALSVVGRVLPEVFAEYADEFTDLVLNQLLEADLSGGKPLRETSARTGKAWGRPSPSAEVKCAVLRTLCQALVPDSPSVQPTQEMVVLARQVFDKLQPLLDLEPTGEAFAPFDLSFPTSPHKRQRRSSGGEEGSDAEEEDAADLLLCTDGAWVRWSAMAGLLRLARAYDPWLPADLYIDMGMACQDVVSEARRAMAKKVHRAVQVASERATAVLSTALATAAGGQGGVSTIRTHTQRAAKYAALLAMWAPDPNESTHLYTLHALREFVVQRRRVAQSVAQATAEAGGGGALVTELPDFLLPFLIFLLAHHPDFPDEEQLQQFREADEEEREEMGYQPGTTPFTPFQAMLQFAVEALIIPTEDPTSSAEIARLVPISLKLLRTIKYCEDPTSDPHTEEAHTLCDMAMVLIKQVADFISKGKSLVPGRFPGQIHLPKLCFKPNLSQEKKMDGSDLPPMDVFVPGLHDNSLFMRRLMPALPGGKAGKRRRPQQQRKQAAAEQEEEGPEGAGQSEGPLDADMNNAGEVGSGSKRKAGSGGRRQKQGRSRKRSSPGSRRREEEEEEEEEEEYGASSDGEQGSERAPAAQAKKAVARKPAAARSKPAPTPTRQQPRRGAKSEAQTKLRADTSDEDGASEPDEAEAGAAADPSESDFEQRSMGSPGPLAASPVLVAAADFALGGGGGSSAGAREARLQRLRAPTSDDEAASQQQEEELEEEEAVVPPQQRRQQQQQKGSHKQQQQPAGEAATSPQQENRDRRNTAGQKRGAAAAKGKQLAPAALKGAKRAKQQQAAAPKSLRA